MSAAKITTIAGVPLFIANGEVANLLVKSNDGLHEIAHGVTVVGNEDGYDVLGLQGGRAGDIHTKVGESPIVSRRKVVLPDGGTIEPLTEEELALERQISGRTGRSKKEFG